MLVFVLALLLLARAHNAFGRCWSNIAESKPAHKLLEISAELNDGSLTLRCTVDPNNFSLQQGQRLVWREGGNEVLSDEYSSAAGRVQLSQSWTSSQLTLTNFSLSQHGQYTCQCENYQLTVEEMRQVVDVDAGNFQYKCSEQQSITLPANGVNEFAVHNHVMREQGVQLSCDADNQTLVRVKENGLFDQELKQTFITLESVSDIGKYLCMTNGNVMSIHYVTTDTVAFLNPYTPHQILTIVGNDYQLLASPICSVYSELPNSDLQLSVTGLQNSYIEDYDIENPAIRNNILFLNSIDDLATLSMSNYTCLASSYLGEQRLSSTLNLIKTSEGKQDDDNPAGAFCVDITTTPSSDGYLPSNTSSLTVNCAMSIDHKALGSPQPYLMFESTNGSRVVINLLSANDGVNYYTEIHNLTLDNEGVYNCVLNSSQHYLQNEDRTLLKFTGNTLESITSTTIIPLATIMPTATAVPGSSDTDLLSGVLESSPRLSNIPSSPIFPSSDIPIWVITVAAAMLVLIVAIVILVVCLIAIRIWLKRNKFMNFPMEMETFAGKAFNKRSDIVRFDNSGDVSISFSFNPMDNDQVRTLLPHDPHNISKNMSKCAIELYPSQWFISYDKLMIEDDLGSGAFGIVKKAKVYRLNEREEFTTVAVKMLKDVATEEEERDIITEFKVLQRVGFHPNVVNLIGASIHEGSLLVIVEFCAGGNLLHYLRKKRTSSDPLLPTDQLHMALDIAQGMEHLAANKCVHRDLAARNILITEDMTLKVADFGLARETYHSQYLKTTKGKVPLKWMAPENIADRVYSTKSDIWSFGILMWEIATLGKSPYPGQSPEEVMQMLQSGKCMSKPYNCCNEMYALMTLCWEQQPEDRPSFTDLIHVIRGVLKDTAPSQSYYNIPDQCACEDGICCCYEDSGVLTEATSEQIHEATAITSFQQQHKHIPSHCCLPYLEILPTHMQFSLSASLGNLCSTCKHNYLVQYLEVISEPNKITKFLGQNRNQFDDDCSSLCEVNVENTGKQMEADPPEHKQNQMLSSLQDALDYIRQGPGGITTAASASMISLCNLCKAQLHGDKSEDLLTASELCHPNHNTDPMYANTPSHTPAPHSKQHTQSIRTTSNDSGNVRDLEPLGSDYLTTDHTNFAISLPQTDSECYCNTPSSLTTDHTKTDLSHIQTENDCRCSTPGSIISGYLKFDQ